MTDNTQLRPLTPGQVQRYSRHLIMPNVGSVGQRKLLNGKVLVIGAGGLGSPIALYLALAGVGTIGIVDFDVVDVSNLQRQILHTEADIGRRKVISAKETLLAHNPDLNVVLHEEPINSENAMKIIPNYHIIVNGADNFSTRYLVNDAAYLAGKPLVDGAILVFDGRATTYLPGQGCYRCMYPDPPPPGEVPNCSEAGVIGALPGLVGSIQALEVIKLLLGIGETLTGRLLMIDALSMEFTELKVRKDPNCKLCGENPEVTALIDYDVFCGVTAPAPIEDRDTQPIMADD
jgi:molybdopterin/thiamine biosynthesis adenylyltransferase